MRSPSRTTRYRSTSLPARSRWSTSASRVPCSDISFFKAVAS
ncbi:Uncharacterised protein [Bordetella pertussis]|nr:Uncharacterised protein [Bordetella pertussis]